MAASAASRQNARIAEHLQCAICLELISDSRVLPGCQHTFCLACLKRLMQQSLDPTRLVCPSCRQNTPLPDTGPDDLPKNRLVNQLIEELQLSEDSSQLCEDCDEQCGASGYCEQCELLLCDVCLQAHVRSKSRRQHTILAIPAHQQKEQADSLPVRELECLSHRGERLEVFCKTCQKAICYKCGVVDHQRCDKGDLGVTCSEKKTTINALISQVQENVLKPLHLAITKTKEHQEVITVSAQKAKADISEHFETCQQLLQQCRQQLLNDVDCLHDRWQRCLLQTLRRFTADLHSAMQVTDASKQIVASKKKSAVISEADNTINKLTSLYETRATSANPTPHLPLPQPITFITDLKALQAAIINMGTVTTNTFMVSHTMTITLQNVLTTFVVKSTTPAALPIVQVQTPQDGPPAEVAVCKHDKVHDSYLIKLKTRALGKHKVCIRVCECEMESVDKSLEVTSVEVPGKPKKVVGGRGYGDYHFNCPRGVTMCNGHVMVADRNNHRLQEFDASGQVIQSFRGNGQLYAAALHPSGVVVATDNSSYQLQIFRRDGTTLHRIGFKGSELGQFINPRGIGLTTDSHMIVADGGNHRVQVIDITGTPIRQFSSCGQHRKLHWPFLLTVDPTNDHIFVANHSGGTVEVFTQNGQHIRSIGKGYGKGPGEMINPTGVALHPSGNVLVTERSNNRVSMFTREGQYVGLWGEMEDPRDVACSENGQVVISQSNHNHCVCFY